jgi:hypothetical protein
MKPVLPIIIFSTLYLLVYTVMSNFQSIPHQVIVGMFVFSPFLVIYMAVKILRDGEPTELTFEESFYEDQGKNRVA